MLLMEEQKINHQRLSHDSKHNDHASNPTNLHDNSPGSCPRGST